jgi:hypothetical protein
MLGPQALKKDNFFFGNYPRSKGSKHNDQPMFEMKRRFGRLFKIDETGLGPGLWSVFLKFVQRVGLRSYPDEEYTKIIMENLVPFDNLTKNFSRLVKHVNRKGKEVKEQMLPTLPKRSPLLSKHESILITGLARHIWDDLDDVKDNYKDHIQCDGFSFVEQRCRHTYTKRWEFLAKFAALTTNRLQEFRKVTPNADKFAKRDFNTDLTLAALKRREDIVQTFFSEVTNLFDMKLIDFILLKEFNKIPEDPKACWEYEMKKKIRQCYLSEQFDAIEDKEYKDSDLFISIGEINSAKKMLKTLQQAPRNLSEKIRNLSADHGGKVAILAATSDIINKFIKAKKACMNLSTDVREALQRTLLWSLSDIDTFTKRYKVVMVKIIKACIERNTSVEPKDKECRLLKELLVFLNVVESC